MGPAARASAEGRPSNPAGTGPSGSAEDLGAVGKGVVGQLTNRFEEEVRAKTNAFLQTHAQIMSKLGDDGDYMPGKETGVSITLLYIIYIALGSDLAVAGSKHKTVNLALVICLFAYDYTSLLFQRLIDQQGQASGIGGGIVKFLSESSFNQFVAILIISMVASLIIITLTKFFFRAAVFFLVVGFFFLGPGGVLFDYVGISNSTYKLVGILLVSLIASMFIAPKLIQAVYRALFAAIGVVLIVMGVDGVFGLDLDLPKAIFNSLRDKFQEVSLKETVAVALAIILSYFIQWKTE